MPLDREFCKTCNLNVNQPCDKEGSTEECSLEKRSVRDSQKLSEKEKEKVNLLRKKEEQL